MTVQDYGAWGALNDELAGPAELDFLQYMRESLPNAARIFEVGIGSGRLALPLARLGFEVSGIDSSAGMLRLLALNDPERRVTAWKADIVHDDDATTYDGVLLAYNVLSMLPDRESLQQGLRNACRHVAPGGLLLIENVAPQAILTQLNERNQTVGVQFYGDDVWLNLGRYFPNDQRFRVRYVAFEHGQVVQRAGDLTLIAADEVCALMAERGFTLLRQSQDWSGQPSGPDSASYVLTFAKQ